VAFSAMALGVGLYVIPLGMIANPALIALETEPFWAVATALKLFVGLAALSYGLISAQALWMRLGLIAAGLAVVFVSF